MSYIFPAPAYEVALFYKEKPKKPKKPMPWWLNLALLLYSAAILFGFGYVSYEFGHKAAPHWQDPHAMAGMVVAFVLGTDSLVAGAIAGKCALRLVGMS